MLNIIENKNNIEIMYVYNIIIKTIIFKNNNIILSR